MLQSSIKIFVLLLIISTIACNKFEDYSYPNINCEELEDGEKRIFVNGKESEFRLTIWPRIATQTFDIHLSRMYSHPVDGRTAFRIKNVPLRKASYDLILDDPFEDKVTIEVSAFSISDGNLAEYVIVFDNEETLEIIELDAEVVVGKFKFKAKLKHANGYEHSEINLPKYCTIEGKFSYDW